MMFEEVSLSYFFFDKCQNENTWWRTEDWLRKRYAEVCSDSKHDEDFKVLGYQWRVLRFNDATRQSAVKVMLASKVSDPSSVCYMQQPHVLAVPCKCVEL